MKSYKCHVTGWRERAKLVLEAFAFGLTTQIKSKSHSIHL